MGQAKRMALEQARILNLPMWLAFCYSVIQTDEIKERTFCDGCQVDKFKELLESIKAFLQLVINLAAIDPAADHFEPKLSTSIGHLWLFEEAIDLLI